MDGHMLITYKMLTCTVVEAYTLMTTAPFFAMMIGGLRRISLKNSSFFSFYTIDLNCSPCSFNLAAMVSISPSSSSHNLSDPILQKKTKKREKLVSPHSIAIDGPTVWVLLKCNKMIAFAALSRPTCGVWLSSRECLLHMIPRLIHCR